MIEAVGSSLVVEVLTPQPVATELIPKKLSEAEGRHTGVYTLKQKHVDEPGMLSNFEKC